MAERNAPSPFDQAFAELDAALIDLDGDGIPDVQVPRNALVAGQPKQQGGNALAANPNLPSGGALPNYGFGSPQGEMRAYNPPSATDTFFDYGSAPARGVVDQFDRAGTAVADAYNDPSLANVTNAGVQSAIAVGRPVAAGAMLAGGMLEGARRDFAPDVFSSANAAPKKVSSGYSPIELPGLSTEQNNVYNEARKRLQNREYQSAGERRTLEAEVNRLADQSSRMAESDAAAQRDIETERKRKQQAEYDRSVQNAEAARDSELARKRRFSDTQVGKVYEATGGAAPMAAAFGMGALGRLAHGGNALGRYVMPAVEGAVAGVSASSLPLLYDATLTDPDNPEKAAYQAYSRELPPGHPRKQEFLDYAGTLPDANPLRETAREEFMNPNRWIMGGLEGAGLGLAGATAASVPARAGNALMRGSSPQPPTAQVITKTKSGTYHGADGRFVSPPRRNP